MELSEQERLFNDKKEEIMRLIDAIVKNMDTSPDGVLIRRNIYEILTHISIIGSYAGLDGDALSVINDFGSYLLVRSRVFDRPDKGEWYKVKLLITVWCSDVSKIRYGTSIMMRKVFANFPKIDIALLVKYLAEAIRKS